MHLFHKQNIFQIDFLPIASKTQKHSNTPKCTEKYQNVAKVANVEGEEVGPLGMEEGANLSQPRHRWLFATEVGRTRSCQYQMRMIRVVKMRKGKRNSEDEGEIVILMLVLSLVTMLMAMLRERECCSQFWTWPLKRGLPVAARVLQTNTTRRKSSSPLSSQ